MFPSNLLIAGLYYVIVIIVTVFSLFGVYLLIRYGRSLSTSLAFALAYSLFFLILLWQSYQVLSGLLT